MRKYEIKGEICTIPIKTLEAIKNLLDDLTEHNPEIISRLGEPNRAALSHLYDSEVIFYNKVVLDHPTVRYFRDSTRKEVLDTLREEIKQGVTDGLKDKVVLEERWLE